MKNRNENKVGARIRETRKSLKLTQQAFAEKLAMSNASLSELETGKFKPGYDFLVKVYKTFNVNLYYLLFGEGEMFIDPVSSFYTGEANFAANVDDVREFLHYFKKSSLMQYFILSEFKTRMMTERQNIDREIAEREKGSPGD